MQAQLDHLLVPAKDRVAAAKFVNTAFGGRLVYSSGPDGHAREILTVGDERQQPDGVCKEEAT